MKIVKLYALLTLTTGLLASSLAMADRGHGGGGHWHGNVGVYIGPEFGPYYSRPYYPRYYADPFYYGYPAPYYSYPQTVIVAPPQQPPVYIEQGQQQPQAIGPQVQAPQSYSAPQQDNFWYHCDKPEGYYPYIKDCPQGWQKVTPEPPRP